MPLYSQSPFDPAPALLVPGTSGYSFGSYSDQTAQTQASVTRSAIVSNVATITLKVFGGPPPAVGQFISTQALTLIPNVTNVKITAVTGFTDFTNGTVSYALTHANVTAGPDLGLAIAPPVEIGDTLTPTDAVTGAAFALAPLTQTNERSIAWSITFPGTPPTSSFEADLQVAIENVDSQYTKIDMISAVTGATQVVSPVAQANFARIAIITNDAATSVVGKISI